MSVRRSRSEKTSSSAVNYIDGKCEPFSEIQSERPETLKRSLKLESRLPEMDKNNSQANLEKSSVLKQNLDRLVSERPFYWPYFFSLQDSPIKT